MSCADSVFDKYFLSVLYANAHWLTNKYRLFSWWGREAFLATAYYGTWLRTWSRSLVDPYIYSTYQYCQPMMYFDWRWGVVFGGLVMMFVSSFAVWGYFSGVFK